jgi:hypothetical protein
MRSSCPIRRGGDGGCHRCRGVVGRGPSAQSTPLPFTFYLTTTSFWGSGRSSGVRYDSSGRPCAKARDGSRSFRPDRADGDRERASDGRRRVHEPRPCEGSALVTPPLVGLRVTAVPERAAAPPIEHREPSMADMNRQDTSSLVDRHRPTSPTRPRRRVGHKRWPDTRQAPLPLWSKELETGVIRLLPASSPPSNQKEKPWRVHPDTGSGVKRTRARIRR